MAEKRSIYLAAPWVNRADASRVKQQLIAAGHSFTARWIDDHIDIGEDAPNRVEELTRQAEEDLEDLCCADTFVILNLRKSEGKATELGYALGKRDCNDSQQPEIWLVGERTINIFYYLPEVHQVATVEELIEELG